MKDLSSTLQLHFSISQALASAVDAESRASALVSRAQRWPRPMHLTTSWAAFSSVRCRLKLQHFEDALEAGAEPLTSQRKTILKHTRTRLQRVQSRPRTRKHGAPACRVLWSVTLSSSTPVLCCPSVLLRPGGSHQVPPRHGQRQFVQTRRGLRLCRSKVDFRTGCLVSNLVSVRGRCQDWKQSEGCASKCTVNCHGQGEESIAVAHASVSGQNRELCKAKTTLHRLQENSNLPGQKSGSS